MKTYSKSIWRWLAGLSAAALMGGCTSLENSGPRTNLVPPESEPPGVLGQPPVVDWLAACDTVARDLTMASVFQTAQSPQVIEIKPIDNQTGMPIDCKIFPETIRGRIIESGNPMIAFRDEMAADQVIEERVNQSDEPLSVSQSRGMRHGTRKPVGPPSEGRVIEEWDSSDTIAGERNTEVSTKVAKADYFLNGKVFAQNESNQESFNTGRRYYQFQFRLTDARTSLIKWEKIYRVMREGTLAPVSR